MAKVIKSATVEMFAPSDRELALRAQIKTGWSTISSGNFRLSPNELKHINQVLERAQALEHMDEVRIGLQMLKHKQLVEKCRGDGVATCRICNKDLTSKRSYTPEPIQFCSDCQMIVCNRCKIMQRSLSGDMVVLCTVCFGERELWKRSGSWLNNSLPSISIPMENLKEIQQQMIQNLSQGRNRESSPRDFVNPYQLEAEDQDDDDDDTSPAGSRLNFTPSPILGGRVSPLALIERKGSPTMSDSGDSRPKSQSDVDEANRSFRSRGGSNLNRRTAINKTNKNRLLSSREQARSRCHSGSRVPGPIESSIMGSSVTSSVPAITIRKPSTQVLPVHRHAKSLSFESPLATETSEDSEPEINSSRRIIRQQASSFDSDIMVIGSDATNANKKQVTSSPSPDFAWSTTPGSRSPQHQSTQKVGGRTKETEFRVVGTDVKSTADDNMFKKVGGTPAKDDDMFKKVSGTPIKDDDMFKKVGGTPTKDDMFKKVGRSPAKDDMFKKVGGTSTKDDVSPIGSPGRSVKPTLPSKPISHSPQRVKASPTSSPAHPPPILPSSTLPAHPPPTLHSSTLPTHPPPTLHSSTLPAHLPPTLTSSTPTPSYPPPTLPVSSSSSSPAHPTSTSLVKSPPHPFPTTSSPAKPPPTHSPQRQVKPILPAKPDGNTDEFKKTVVKDTKLETVVVPVTTTPLTSPKQQAKPAITARKRILPTIPGDSSQAGDTERITISDIGKQASNTSIVSSEISIPPLETDYSNVSTSPTSLTSSGSGESQNRYGGVVESDGHHPGPEQPSVSPRFSRRNAQRDTTRRKRPPLHPRVAADSGIAEEGSDGNERETPSEDGTASPRFRSRSGVVRRPARKQQRAPDGSPVPSRRAALSESSSTTPPMGEEPSSRSTSVSGQDRASARRARELIEKRGREGERFTPEYKADGTFGSIRMTLCYSEDLSELTVTVHSCKGLRAMDKCGSSDPYVKLFLIPRNKSQKFRTKTIFKNLNPTYEEIFTFTGLMKESLEKKQLCVVVMDHDELSKDDLIGTTQIKLYELLHANEICIKRLLDDRTVPKAELITKERGMIQLQIHYSLQDSALVVSVLGARNLDSHGPQAYVNIAWESRSYKAKVKTKVSPKTAHPDFNEELTISAGLADLPYSTMVVGVWDHRSFKDKLLGEVHFNSVLFWKEFSQDPSKVVKNWFSLEAPSVSSPSPNKFGTLPRK